MNTIRRTFGQLTCLNVPCLITLTGTTIGLLALFAGIRGELLLMVTLVGLTHFCDLSDGFVARKIKKTSEFGEMLDSLNDCFNFCVLIPALGYILGSRTWWSVISYVIYMVCGIIRLAYYNLNTTKGEKGFFTGMSSPIASGIITIFGMYTLSGVVPFLKNNIDYFTAPLFIVLALMMVSSMKHKKYGIFSFFVGLTALFSYIGLIYKFVIVL
ncbi:MAG: phosphatidylserine synthase [Clostridiales bacterium]|jgi:CDP-diacylglycerol--serine O-phosphatidyltransferase|nr:phosphatidylserine synthase [Clostridiales bacterium]